MCRRAGYVDLALCSVGDKVLALVTLVSFRRCTRSAGHYKKLCQSLGVKPWPWHENQTMIDVAGQTLPDLNLVTKLAM